MNLLLESAQVDDILVLPPKAKDSGVAWKVCNIGGLLFVKSWTVNVLAFNQVVSLVRVPLGVFASDALNW